MCVCVCVFESLSSREGSCREIEDMKRSGRKYLVAIQSVAGLYRLGSLLQNVGHRMSPRSLNLVERLAS